MSFIQNELGRLTATESWWAGVLFERGIAVMYLIAFLVALNQFPALLGDKGFLPTPDFLARHRFRTHPSLFFQHYSDRLLQAMCWIGIGISLATALGALAAAPWLLVTFVWLILWTLYLSIVNVGQRFYSFGWESLLLEAGFAAAFLGPQWMEPSLLPLLFVRWMLFRVELGSGLIKWRAGGVWRDLTALYYHHETQPMPNPISWYVHRTPRPLLRAGVMFSHFVQLAVPFALFLPQPLAGIAALLIIIHQLLLIVAGNYAWLNWITIVLAFVLLPDAWLAPLLGAVPPTEPRPLSLEIVLLIFTGAMATLSVKPAKNLCSRHQLMNYSYNPLHLVNAYGAFGSVTTKRYEIIVEGTDAETPSEDGAWREYQFKAKPGNLARCPPQYAPYHLRLDWLMWFLPFSITVTSNHVFVQGIERWFLNFVHKLLQNDPRTLKLLKKNPFHDSPPRHIRARVYLYRFTTRQERRDTGHWWHRTLVGDYLPPVNLDTLRAP